MPTLPPDAERVYPHRSPGLPHVQHAGRRPLATAEDQRKRTAAETLQRQMEQAVALEDFETAAQLRDQLRALSANGEEKA